MVVADLRPARAGRRVSRVSRSKVPSRLALVALGLLLAVGLLEGGLRLAGALSSAERGSFDGAGDSIVVLCIGDSHTWGNGEGVPARLAERLAERSPRFRVVNLGVPGTNTAQHRKRFDRYLDRFDPSLIVFWAGLNNVWNRTDTESWTQAGVEEASWWRSLLDEIRILRFFRVWRYQAELNEVLASDDAYVVPEMTEERTWLRKVKEQRIGGESDTFVNAWGEDASELAPELVTRATAGDLDWMITRARERGVPVLPITYPHERSHFRNVNGGIRWAARNTDTPVVVGSAAKRRLVARERAAGRGRPDLFDRTAHPTQVLYAEIADLALETIDEHGLLPDVEGDPGPSAGPPEAKDTE